MPSVVTFSDGSTIRYMYSADGTKLRTTHVINGTTTTTDYCGNVIYENGTAERLLTDGGYVDLTTATPTYYYYLTDHQGNNRAVISAAGSSVLETNHYYPFGGLFSTSTNAQPYKYNGKELDTKKGLNLYDYGARHYDAALGRWHVVDPMAEKYGALSPYGYCANNPIKFLDIQGMFIGDFYDRNGNFIGTDGIDDDKLYLLNSNVSFEIINQTTTSEGYLTSDVSDFLKQNSTEVNGLIIQDRYAEGDDFTVSQFRTIGGNESVNGYTLEPAGPSTSIANTDRRISEGVYDIDNYVSAKYPNNFILYNDDVSKDRKILYHTGNIGKDTEGCLLPGTGYANGAVFGSRIKFNELRSFINGRGVHDVKLIINNKIK